MGGEFVVEWVEHCGSCNNPFGVFNPECPGRDESEVSQFGPHWRRVWKQVSS